MKESEEEEEVSTQHQGQHQDHGWGLTQHPPGLPLHHPLVRCQTRAVAATLPPCLPGTSWEVRDGGRGGVLGVGYAQGGAAVWAGGSRSLPAPQISCSRKCRSDRGHRRERRVGRGENAQAVSPSQYQARRARHAGR